MEGKIGGGNGCVVALEERVIIVYVGGNIKKYIPIKFRVNEGQKEYGLILD